MLGSIKATCVESKFDSLYLFYDINAIGATESDKLVIESALTHERIDDINYAYSLIFAYTDEPFTTLLPETLFHATSFLINTIRKQKPPPGVSMTRIIFTLAQHAQQLEAYKLALIEMLPSTNDLDNNNNESSNSKWKMSDN